MLIYDLERTLHLNKNTIVQPIEINAKEIVHFKFKTYNAYRLFKDVYCVNTPSLNLEFENNEKIANINNFIFAQSAVFSYSSAAKSVYAFHFPLSSFLL